MKKPFSSAFASLSGLCVSAVNFFPIVPAFLLSAGLVVAQEEDLKNQPAPKAVPVEDLLPKFDADGVVVSHSEQFKISGGDAATRGTAANLAEETKTELLALTEEKDEWKVPVFIDLRGKPGDPVPRNGTVLKLFFNDTGYEVRVFVNLSRDLQREPFKRAVMTALIYARGLKDRAKEESEIPLNVPPWFSEGMLEANAWRLKQTDRRLYDALFQHGGLFKLNDLFTLSESEFDSIDAASRAAFRVSSGALVMALLEQPDGKDGIRDFLAELPDFQGEMPALLRKHFPELNLSEDSMEKWWALQLANKGTAPLTEAFSVPVTERLLNETLRIRHKDDQGTLHEIPFSEWKTADEMEMPQRIDSVRQAQDDLIRLSFRCFPSYRMLLLEYQSLITDFAKGETKNLDKSLITLAETRHNMVEKASRARDFLDWFEITRARETSGAFEDYLNLKARLKTRPNTRTDDLSKYLDRLDPLFKMPEQRDPYSMGENFLPF